MQKVTIFPPTVKNLQIANLFFSSFHANLFSNSKASSHLFFPHSPSFFEGSSKKKLEKAYNFVSSDCVMGNV